MPSRDASEDPTTPSRGARGRFARPSSAPLDGASDRAPRGPREGLREVLPLRPAGVDGCRGGWVVATRDAVVVVPRLAPLLRSAGPGCDTHPGLGTLDIVGVDMPIGLPARPGRAADSAARALLGPRRSSVFPAPARAVVGHRTHADANAASRALFGVGLSVQTFHLFDKIREIDDLVRSLPAEQRTTRVVEVHPECSFRMMTGRVLPAKRTAEGVRERTIAITREYGPLPSLPRGAGIDDVLDAFAALWSAERLARGEHEVLPPLVTPEVDECGLAMRIVV